MNWKILRVRHLESDFWKVPRFARRVVQPEPFRLINAGDGERGHSWVIPIPRTDRALRFGGYFRVWAGVGPRRYQVRMSRQFVEQMERLHGATGSTPDRFKELARERGWQMEGDLRAVPDETDPT